VSSVCVNACACLCMSARVCVCLWSHQVMGADVMRSVKHLLPDILQRLPVLLYQVRAYVRPCV
jgi:hypothetical protein